jgi:hypothetical protein
MKRGDVPTVSVYNVQELQRARAHRGLSDGHGIEKSAGNRQAPGMAKMLRVLENRRVTSWVQPHNVSAEFTSPLPLVRGSHPTNLLALTL